MWLSRFLGEIKLPIFYVARTEDFFPTGFDSRAGEANTDYTTHEDEMVARAPIFINIIDDPVTGEFVQDNRLVWQHIQNLTKKIDCWHIVKPY